MCCGGAAATARRGGVAWGRAWTMLQSLHSARQQERKKNKRSTQTQAHTRASQWLNNYGDILIIHTCIRTHTMSTCAHARMYMHTTYTSTHKRTYTCRSEIYTLQRTLTILAHGCVRSEKMPDEINLAYIKHSHLECSNNGRYFFMRNAMLNINA